MIQRFLYAILVRRHFWRYVGFDQLGELYTSMMLRSVGLSLIGVFVPIYLYLNGYSLVSVALFMGSLFVVRAIADVVSGYLVAAVGPKHVILQSYVLQVVSLVLLLTLPEYDWPLWWLTFSWGFSLSMFFVAYHVDFSKIMHATHGGKELGVMTILERCGAAVGPLIGGLVATMYGAEYTILAAIGIFVIASIPLLLTAEPIKRHQKISFSGLPFRKLWRDFTSFYGMALEANVAIAIWPLYVALFLVASNTYAAIGLVTTIGVVAAILSAKAVGLLIDHRRGRALLSLSAMLVSVSHIFRLFVGSLGGVALLNAANETVSTGTRLPYTKGMYARANDLPGYRIAYLVSMESISDTGKALPWFLLALLLGVVSDQFAFHIIFVVAAIFTLMIRTQRFPALIKPR